MQTDEANFCLTFQALASMAILSLLADLSKRGYCLSPGSSIFRFMWLLAFLLVSKSEVYLVATSAVV